MPIYREELMRYSKICSRATYHRCIKHLSFKGYLHYYPSLNPNVPSKVAMNNLVGIKDMEELQALAKEPDDNSTSQGSNQLDNAAISACITSSLADSQAASRVESHVVNIVNEPSNEPFNKNINKQVNDDKQGEGGHSDTSNSQEPSLFQVTAFFASNQFSEVEAQKFYHHFASNGWLVGGKTPMQNWHASAHKWMLNIDNFKPKKYDANKFKPRESNAKKNFDESL